MIQKQKQKLKVSKINNLFTTYAMCFVSFTGYLNLHNQNQADFLMKVFQFSVALLTKGMSIQIIPYIGCLIIGSSNLWRFTRFVLERNVLYLHY